MMILLASTLDKWKYNEPIFPDRATAWRMAALEFVVFDVPILIALFVMWKSVSS